jgi:tRNA pseudouridine55 synthase
VDKPAGVTSHDVVARLRRVLGTKAVGHTGTLDPFATGLLVTLVGRATRLARFVEGQPKTYRGTLRLGVQTDTDDLTGSPVGGTVPDAWPAEAEVRAALETMVGTQQQRPPAFSAKHVDGVRSHRLARRGVAVELAPVEVTIHAIELLAWHAPDAEFRVTVSPGTYVRAIARDVGTRLGLGAHLVALRRESIGGLQVDDAVALEAIDATALRPPLAVLDRMPRVELDEAALAYVQHGRAIAMLEGAQGAHGAYVALVCGSQLVAVAEVDETRLQPVVVLSTADALTTHDSRLPSDG